jgi:hypothetical protein
VRDIRHVRQARDAERLEQRSIFGALKVVRLGDGLARYTLKGFICSGVMECEVVRGTEVEEGETLQAGRVSERMMTCNHD